MLARSDANSKCHKSDVPGYQEPLYLNADLLRVSLLIVYTITFPFLTNVHQGRCLHRQFSIIQVTLY